ncbi:hypothetical protein CDD80_1110 [Ophiocordyceps camponoti-rufipedis]|uniref:Cytochrome b5 heme-binding domain-containing protein n=1 Tax=Ophiocordyceps camponoti-rufipedis TaxID=2004952 RepID=A0A2C5YAZ4_9HYPO|nr:hypothetical protein CDD80_1110 [Ophiocordyceps camponoti-rufipedis]
MTSETTPNLAGESSKVKKKVGKITVNGEDIDAREESSLPWVDGLRVLSFLLIAWYGLSYVVSGGESWTWGVQPDFMKTQWWMAKIRGPLSLTLDELKAYDGRDADKPLYLSVNGTIYDVSLGRKMYGPGGYYEAFAGRDNSRAFITSCLENDNVPDVRGAEAAFLPLDHPETDAAWTTTEMAAMRKHELAVAKEKAHAALKNWVDFFAKSPKYPLVGYLKWDPAELQGKPLLPLCPKAQRGRLRRNPANRRS